MAIRHHISKQDILNKVMDKVMMNQSTKTVLLHNTHMEDIQILSQPTLKPMLKQIMHHHSSMASHHCMACHLLKDNIHNLMATQELLNQVRFRIRVLLQHNHMAQCSNHIHMHHLRHHKRRIPHMGLHQLQMVTITSSLHLDKFMLSLVDSPVMGSPVPRPRLVMHNLLVMDHIHLLSRLTLNNQPLTMQFMATKHPKILLTAALHKHTVLLQLCSQVMFNLRQLKLVTTNLTHSQQFMLPYQQQQVLKLRMARLYHLSLPPMPSMTPPKFMVLLDDLFFGFNYHILVLACSSPLSPFSVTCSSFSCNMYCFLLL
jgi:hypothetical protein